MASPRSHASAYAAWQLVQLTVPPPERCEVATRDMLTASRTLDVETFWNQYYIPTPPSVQEESEESEPDVSPSLVDSEDIRREFGHLGRDGNEHDDISLMQKPPSDPRSLDNQPASSSQAASSTDVAVISSQPADGHLAEAVHQIVNDSCLLQFNPRTTERWPLWYRALATFFGDEAHTENDDEGPVAYLTTWFADCSVESTNEHPRTVRLDSQTSLWAHDIQHTWRDKIQTGSPVHFAWVFPKPVDAPVMRTIGHLIV